MAFTYCDARACYDRIVVIMSALAEQAAGLAPEKSIFFTRTLTLLKYKMLTAYGPLAQTNYHSEQHPVHGVGQRPTDGPPTWTCTVNTPLVCYDRKAKGCILFDPTKKIRTQQNAKMFIDDNRKMHNNRIMNATTHQLMSFVEHNVNLWDELLWITGGLLERLKQCTASWFGLLKNQGGLISLLCQTYQRTQ
eukprot:8715194-Ditylum_brightwellii.AAC.1